MTRLNFRIALFNTISTGPYDFPATTTFTGSEWLIVERRGDFLMVSDTNIATTPADAAQGAPAPAGLRPRHMQVSQRIAGAASDEGVDFLLLRHLPDGIVTEAPFFPADGYNRLSQPATGAISLITHGRHYHLSRTLASGQTVLIDGGLPHPDSGGKLNWHFDAVQRPWTGETI